MQSAKDVDRSSSLADCITDFIARTFLQHSRNSLVYVTVRLYDVVSRTSECLLFENLGTTSPFLPIVYIHLQPHYHASSSSGPMLSHDQKSTKMAGTTQAHASEGIDLFRIRQRWQARPRHLPVKPSTSLTSTSTSCNVNAIRGVVSASRRFTTLDNPALYIPSSRTVQLLFFFFLLSPQREHPFWSPQQRRDQTALLQTV